MQKQAASDIAAWRVKQFLKDLSDARGDGTSLISLVVPAGGQISRVQQMLSHEKGTASHIKSHATKKAVLTALSSSQQRLRGYNKTPDNGLVVYCGMVNKSDESNGHEKKRKVTIAFEPPEPLRYPVYHCDNRFHTEFLEKMLTRDKTCYGFVVIDGSSCILAHIHGSERKILHK